MTFLLFSARTTGTSSSIAVVVSAMAGLGLLLQQLLTQSNLTRSIQGSLAPLESSLISSIKKDEKPLLILHIGPSKTGTSTIQKYAEKHQRLMEKDNIFFLGHSNEEHPLHQKSHICMHACPRDETSCSACDKEWSDFREQLDYHYSQNHNVFVSEEMFLSWETNPFILKYLLPSIKPWRVRVVYTYRRCYEWLRSRYLENYEDYILADPEGNYLKWPEDGGGEIESFWQVIEGKQRCPSHKIAPYREHFEDVEIFNMHEHEGPLIVRFFCEMMPEATQLCSYALSGGKDFVANSLSSKSPLMYYDQLVVAAYERNLIDKSKGITRSKARLAAMHHANRLGLSVFEDFPHGCLDEEKRNLLLEMSLKEEEAVVPAFHQSENGEAYLRQTFASEGIVDKFCFPNVDAFLDVVLKAPDWKVFFFKLGKRKWSIFSFFWHLF